MLCFDSTFPARFHHSNATETPFLRVFTPLLCIEYTLPDGLNTFPCRFDYLVWSVHDRFEWRVCVSVRVIVRLAIWQPWSLIVLWLTFCYFLLPLCKRFICACIYVKICGDMTILRGGLILGDPFFRLKKRGLGFYRSIWASNRGNTVDY